MKYGPYKMPDFSKNSVCCQKYYDGKDWIICVTNVDKEDSICYYKEDGRVYHRGDGPAIQYFLSSVTVSHYLKDGYHHREDGPAVEWSDGKKEYYLFGDQYDSLPSPEEIENIKKEMVIKKCCYEVLRCYEQK